MDCEPCCCGGGGSVGNDAAVGGGGGNSVGKGGAVVAAARGWGWVEADEGKDSAGVSDTAPLPVSGASRLALVCCMALSMSVRVAVGGSGGARLYNWHDVSTMRAHDALPWGVANQAANREAMPGIILATFCFFA